MGYVAWEVQLYRISYNLHYTLSPKRKRKFYLLMFNALAKSNVKKIKDTC